MFIQKHQTNKLITRNTYDVKLLPCVYYIIIIVIIIITIIVVVVIITIITIIISSSSNCIVIVIVIVIIITITVVVVVVVVVIITIIISSSSCCFIIGIVIDVNIIIIFVVVIFIITIIIFSLPLDILPLYFFLLFTPAFPGISSHCPSTVIVVFLFTFDHPLSVSVISLSICQSSFSECVWRFMVWLQMTSFLRFLHSNLVVLLFTLYRYLPYPYKLSDFKFRIYFTGRLVYNGRPKMRSTTCTTLFCLSKKTFS